MASFKRQSSGYTMGGKRVSYIPTQSASGGGYTSSGASQLYQQRYAQATSLLDQLSDQQRKDLLASYSGLAGQATQGLMSRGLAGTTILPSMQAGILRQRQGAMNNLNDQIARERMAAMSSYTSGQAGAMSQDASAQNSFNLSRRGYDLQSQQMGNNMAMDIRRLNQGVRAPTQKRYNTTVFSGTTNSYPGSYGSLQSRYSRRYA
jgi:hypothetical protein